MSEPTLQIGKFLVIAGLLLAVLGLVLMWGSRYSFFGLGKLPGDILYKGKNTTFYFPVVTCLLLSALVTFLFWVFSSLGRK